MGAAYLYATNMPPLRGFLPISPKSVIISNYSISHWFNGNIRSY
ncbi:Uncharacterized protein dnm_072550 [Desulfonema magnum]|uniref:Uncharacterized protein n=1 Tax=Desulfonema magnum TaxID=45655 RepID=A0A975BT56_9BACT|nr:Uncharacterized protein dnm_072550 [Desulfonema magnum]